MFKVFLLLVQLLAFWPVGRWYILRLIDPSDEPWGIIALGTALLIVFLNRAEKRPVKVKLIIPILLLLFYSVTFSLLPPLLRAAIAVTALGCTLSSLYLGHTFQPGILGLLLLSLPVIPSMQFYLGYPLRIITGKLSVILLQLTGFPVALEGVAFNWNGELVWIDVLCSGVRNMWAGMCLTFALTAFYNFGAKKTTLVTGFSLLALIIANTLRSTALFYIEAGIVAVPWWVHKGIGMLVFLFAAIAIAWVTQKIQKPLTCETSLST
jgi:exosortase/archaeosortase family protein